MDKGSSRRSTSAYQVCNLDMAVSLTSSRTLKVVVLMHGSRSSVSIANESIISVLILDV